MHLLILLFLVPGILLGSLAQPRSRYLSQEAARTYADSKRPAQAVDQALVQKAKEFYQDLQKAEINQAKQKAFFKALAAMPEDVIKKLIRKDLIEPFRDDQKMVTILEAIPQEVSRNTNSLTYKLQAARAAIYHERALMYRAKVAQLLHVSLENLDQTISQKCQEVDQTTRPKGAPITYEDNYGVPLGKLGRLEAFEQWKWLADTLEKDPENVWERQRDNYPWSKYNVTRTKDSLSDTWHCDANQQMIDKVAKRHQLREFKLTVSREEAQAAQCAKSSVIYFENLNYLPACWKTNDSSAVFITNVSSPVLAHILRDELHINDLIIQSCNSMQDVIWESVTKLPHLKQLTIVHCGLTTLSQEIGNLKNLSYLSLDFNNLTSLCPEIGRLHELQVLRVQHNRLVDLPDTIHNLPKLEYLYLEDNQFSAIPKALLSVPNSKMAIMLSNNPVAQQHTIEFPSNHYDLMHNWRHSELWLAPK